MPKYHLYVVRIFVTPQVRIENRLVENDNLEEVGETILVGILVSEEQKGKGVFFLETISISFKG
jgi:hypothetical protein